MKGKDALEEFITTHRTSFDNLKAPPGVWARIDQNDHKVHHLWKWSAVAASALLLLAIGYILGNSMQAPSTPEWAEYQETESFYTARVNQKMDEVKALPVSADVLSDLEMLDDVYNELRKQLLADPNADPQILLTAMVKHNKQKLEVLERIIDRVNKYQNNEKQNHEI